jgi:hypothetical protein
MLSMCDVTSQLRMDNIIAAAKKTGAQVSVSGDVSTLIAYDFTHRQFTLGW